MNYVDTMMPAPETLPDYMEMEDGYTFEDDHGPDTDSTEYTGAETQWRITNDRAADWAAGKIAEEKAELARLQALAEEKIAEIEARFEAQRKRFENRTGYLMGKLEEYFRTVKPRTTKTQMIYQLDGKKLVMKLGGSTMQPNDKVLVGYLKTSGNEDLINIVEKPKWGEFKKRLKVENGHVVDTTTGEIVTGVDIVEKPDVFTVEV